ncbi:MAG: TMEM175 family protein [Candidatus Omnitrophota bacterium]
MNMMQDKTLPHRISALIDGVFAIVMTILVLDIKLPHDIYAYSQFNIDQFLTGYFQDIIIYMIVFIILGYLWYIHHNQARFIQHTDRNHLWINILTLMFIALLPFSSSLVNRFPGTSVAEIFLAANLFIVGIFNYLNWAYATKLHHLVDENLSNSYIKAEKTRLLIFPLVSLIAMAIALVYPLFSMYALLIAPILIFFVRLSGNKS